MKKTIKFSGNTLVQSVVMSVMTAVLICLVILPLTVLLARALYDTSGNYVGIQNFIKYLSTPSMSSTVTHSVFISTVTMAISTVLGYSYAYALTRTDIRGKRIFRYIALIPLFMPTMTHGIGLVYLLGKKGFLTMLGVHVELYGPVGIILSEVIYTFPQAYMMLFVSLSYADGRLHEASETLGAGPVRRFFTVTLPGTKYTVINTMFVSFTLAFTDFGAPKVLGGNYNVLATDIYKQVIGQFNIPMGAVVGTFLIIPALISFVVDRLTQRRHSDGISSRATRINIRKSGLRDALYFIFCSGVALGILLLLGIIVFSAFIKNWPYNLSFVLTNFRFDISTGGLKSFTDSLIMSTLTAAAGTAFVFVYTYFIEKGRRMKALKAAGSMLSLLPMALPGLVIGLSYILFFNHPDNPLHFIYGTVVILVAANIIHFYSVAYITAASALKNLDSEIEAVSESMNVGGAKTFFRVTLPLCLPAVIEIAMYYFVNSMVTISALVFIYSAKFPIASVAISNMEDAGNYAKAAAMSVLILVTNVLVRILYELFAHRLKKRSGKIRQ